MREVRGSRQSDTVQSVLMILWTRSRMGLTRSQWAITSGMDTWRKTWPSLFLLAMLVYIFTSKDIQDTETSDKKTACTSSALFSLGPSAPSVGGTLTPGSFKLHKLSNTLPCHVIINSLCILLINTIKCHKSDTINICPCIMQQYDSLQSTKMANNLTLKRLWFCTKAQFLESPHILY